MKENLKNLKRTNKVNFWHIALISFIMIFAIAVVVNIRALATDEDSGETEENSSNVTYVTTTDGYNIPVPEGFTASKVDGETNGSTGFVIYEGDIDWDTVLSDTAVSDWNAVIYGSSASVSATSLEAQSIGDETDSADEETQSSSESEESGISLTSEDGSTSNESSGDETSSSGSSSDESSDSSSSDENTSEETTNVAGESSEESTDEQGEISSSENSSTNDNTESSDSSTQNGAETTGEENSSANNSESGGNTESTDSDSQDEQTDGTEQADENGTDEDQGTTDEETSQESEEDETSSIVLTMAATGDDLTQEDINILNLQTKVNQYVWVPVETPSRIYGVDSSGKLWGKLYSTWNATDPESRTKYNWSISTDGIVSITSLTSYREPDVTAYLTAYDIDSKLSSYLDGDTRYELLSKELEQSFYNIMQSIEKYGGFYIGRYETGGLSSTNSNTAVVRKMDTSISSVTWYVMYEQCKSLGYENDNVETSMIWGCLWDETLQWFLESGATDSNGDAVSVTNSTSWGNYSNSYSLFSYYTSSTWETTTRTSSGKIPAGSADYTKVNNIYDMAGNVWDWTLEANSSNYRVFRGGSYNYSGSSSPASYRNFNVPANSSVYIGCRSVLYIK